MSSLLFTADSLGAHKRDRKLDWLQLQDFEVQCLPCCFFRFQHLIARNENADGTSQFTVSETIGMTNSSVLSSQ
jgi:hypothetical protein